MCGHFSQRYLSLRLYINIFPYSTWALRSDCASPFLWRGLHLRIQIIIVFLFIYVLHYEYYIAYNWHAHTFTLSLFLHCLRLVPRACFLNQTSLTHISPSSFCFFVSFLFFVELLFELRAIKIITIEYTIGCQSTHSHTFHRTNGINVSAARPLLLLSSQRNSCPTFLCNMHGHGSRSRSSVCNEQPVSATATTTAAGPSKCCSRMVYLLP